MMGNLMKALRVLENKEKTFREQARSEMEKARVEGFAFNRRKMDHWLTGLVKVRVQEELVKAKTSQILTFSDQLTFSQPASMTHLSPLFESEDPDVTEEIQRFSSWIENRIAPTEEEVAVVAKKKAEGILSEVHDVFLENQLDQN